MSHFVGVLTTDSAEQTEGSVAERPSRDAGVQTDGSDVLELCALRGKVDLFEVKLLCRGDCVGGSDCGGALVLVPEVVIGAPASAAGLLAVVQCVLQSRGADADAVLGAEDFAIGEDLGEDRVVISDALMQSELQSERALMVLLSRGPSCRSSCNQKGR